MALRVFGMFLLFSLQVQLVAAQVRQISGRVTNSQTDEGLGGATVAVSGTGIVAETSPDGNYVLNAPDGDRTLVVRAIGFKRRQLEVPAGQATADATLDPDVFKLEEIVITGQATGVERQNLPNAVATVSSDELNRAPAQTIESALQGKIPGAYIQANSGAPGGGFQLNLRGVSTIIGSVDPLYVVDGIVVSNVAIPNGQNAVSCAQCGGNPRNQDNPVNRIADLNPEDIERIEVLKGGSAAAIYGSKATNGVVIITTKRGKVGKPQFAVSQKFGFSSRANELGSRTFTSLAEALTVFRDTAAVTAAFQPGRTFDHEDELYGRRSLSYETNGSVSGGTEKSKYYISGLVKNDEGIALNTGYKKQSLRSNIDQELGSGFQIQVNIDGTHSLSKRGLSNNDNSGTSPYMVFPQTPSFIDLLPAGGIRDGLLASDFPTNTLERSNPIQTFQILKNEEDVWRMLGTSTLRWSAIRSAHSNLQFIGIGGVDYFQQDNNLVSPPELQYEPADGQPGSVVLSKSSNRNLNAALNMSYRLNPSESESGAEWTTSAGVQYEERRLFATQILARTLLPGQESPQQTTSQSVTSKLEPVRDLGIFAQEEVLLANRRLLLTAGVRGDRSSSNGRTGRYFLYPKVAASYRFLHPFGGLDEIKLRGAYGQTGNRPSRFDAKYSNDTTGTIGGQFGTSIGGLAGDPLIQPERQEEFEGGFDASLAGGRAELTLTVYQRNIRDLILEQTIAPSLGQETRIFSSDSRLRNRGVEASLTVQPVQGRKVNWISRATFFANKGKITQLAVPPFQTGGFALSLGTYQIEEGSSPTQIFGLVGTDPVTGEAIAGKVGDASPDFQISFSNDIDINRFTLGFLFDWKHGGDIINLTQFLYDAVANTSDFVGAGAARFNRFGAGFTQPYVQDGSYLKLREVNLSYNLPDGFTSRLFGGSVRYARLSLTGRNLLRITPYDGLDPEVSNFGNQAIVRNIDVAPFPPSRSFYFSVDLGF
ncbi:MAG: SusC/RagA family TonB-linked outer membrane protein [Gemmatimonadales bacterium]